MIYAVCFKDNHTAKQTHEKEAVSVSRFPVAAFCQPLRLEGYSVIVKPTVMGRRTFLLFFQCPVPNSQCLGWWDFSWFCSLPFLLLMLCTQASFLDCKIEAKTPACLHYLLIPDIKRMHCFTVILYSARALFRLI